jgi:hypothetical protein
MNSILRARELAAADVHSKIRDKVAQLHDEEARYLGAQEALGS